MQLNDYNTNVEQHKLIYLNKYSRNLKMPQHCSKDFMEAKPIEENNITIFYTNK